MRHFCRLALMLTLLAACAPTRPAMSTMNEREVRECEAQGGSVQPAYALHQYVCYFSGPETQPAPSTPPAAPN
jgi:hypothetical protein